MKHEEMQRDRKMTTKVKLTVAEVVLVIVLAMGLLTAVPMKGSSVAAGTYLPDVAGEACTSSCTNGG
ncbi:MAG: hypothetical protein KF770_18585 [Anaerolineae bacterium]|nr:hypothetical protein [Anaerolineae bacterium]